MLDSTILSPNDPRLCQQPLPTAGLGTQHGHTHLRAGTAGFGHRARILIRKWPFLPTTLHCKPSQRQDS